MSTLQGKLKCFNTRFLSANLVPVILDLLIKISELMPGFFQFLVNLPDLCISILSFHLVDIKLYLIHLAFLLECENFFLHFVHDLDTLLGLNLEGQVFMEIDVSLRSVILTNHIVLVDDLQETRLHRIELILQLGNVLLLGLLKLFHDFFLGIKFTVENFIFSHGFIQ